VDFCHRGGCLGDESDSDSDLENFEDEVAQMAWKIEQRLHRGEALPEDAVRATLDTLRANGMQVCSNRSEREQHSSSRCKRRRR